MNQLIKILVFSFAFVIVSCGGEEDQQKKSKPEEPISHAKGTVVYSIYYPYFQGDKFVKAMFLPKEMFLVFNEGKINQYTKKGELMKIGVMGSPEEDSVSIYMDFGSLDIRSNFSGKAIKYFIDNQTRLKIELVEGEEKKLAGFNCKKAIGRYADGSNPDFTIWYTEEIEIANPNFYNSYSEIPGVLMEFEMERFGLVSRMVADTFTVDLPEKHTFELDTNFMKINFEKFQNELRDIFEKSIGVENLTPKKEDQ